MRRRWSELKQQKMTLPQIKESEQWAKTRVPHEWDSSGERCVKCGDKDWCADMSCSETLLKHKRLERNRIVFTFVFIFVLTCVLLFLYRTAAEVP